MIFILRGWWFPAATAGESAYRSNVARATEMFSFTLSGKCPNPEYFLGSEATSIFIRFIITGNGLVSSVTQVTAARPVCGGCGVAGLVWLCSSAGQAHRTRVPPPGVEVIESVAPMRAAR